MSYRVRRVTSRRLTPEGERQASALNDDLLRNTSFVAPELIVVSTLSRTMQTAALAFDGVPGAPTTFVSTELCRERIADHECDHRRKRSVLVKEFPFVDFSEVSEEGDTLWRIRKESDPDEMNSDLCTERAVEFLSWLRGRPERRIAVVSHWVFFRHLFALHPVEGFADFKNAELRVARLGGGARAEL